MKPIPMDATGRTLRVIAKEFGGYADGFGAFGNAEGE
jgi:hypothetical protein